METLTHGSVIDLTLRARHLRSAYLAGLLTRALSRLRGDAAKAATVPAQSELALERR